MDIHRMVGRQFLAPGGLARRCAALVVIALAAAFVPGVATGGFGLVILPTGNISGTITGIGGVPLPDVVLQAKSPYYGLFEGDSGTDGSFSISVSVVGSGHPGYALEIGSAEGPYYGCYNPGYAGSLDIPKGAPVSDCAQVPDGTSGLAISIRASGLYIRGEVTDSSGKPLAGISAYPASADGTGYGMDTRADGTYALSVAASDSYAINFTDQSRHYLDGCYNSADDGHIALDQRTCATVSVGAANVPGIDVTMVTTVPQATPTSTTDGATPAGTNVIVSPAISGGAASGITATFASVSSPGVTTVLITKIAPGPVAPGGFRLASSPIYYDVSTTATYSGPIALCLPYDPSAYADPGLIRLLHWDGGANWIDVTSALDSVQGLVCGRVDSLSPFVVVQEQELSGPWAGPGPTQGPANSGGSGFAGGFLLAVVALAVAAGGLFFLFRRYRPNKGAK